MNGNGAAWEAVPLVASGFDNEPLTYLGDLDGDGDLDVAMCTHFGATEGVARIAWAENRDGRGGEWMLRPIAVGKSFTHAIVAADFDNDGDLDLALTDEIADVIVLQKNLGTGSGVGIPADAARAYAAPNPFRDATRLRFALSRAGSVRFEVFDASGRLVRAEELVERAVGWQEHPFDGRDADGRRLPSGNYLYRLIANEEQVRGRIAIVR